MDACHSSGGEAAGRVSLEWAAGCHPGAEEQDTAPAGSAPVLTTGIGNQSQPLVWGGPHRPVLVCRALLLPSLVRRDPQDPGPTRDVGQARRWRAVLAQRPHLPSRLFESGWRPDLQSCHTGSVVLRSAGHGHPAARGCRVRWPGHRVRDLPPERPAVLHHPRHRPRGGQQPGNRERAARAPGF